MASDGPVSRRDGYTVVSDFPGCVSTAYGRRLLHHGQKQAQHH